MPETKQKTLLPKKTKLVLGWREWVQLPEMNVSRIKAKIDSGARTSALHATQIEFLTQGKTRWVRFIVHPQQKNNRYEIRAVAELIEERVIKTSPGHSTLRPVIRTRLGIGGKEVPIELTLINRDIMGFRMLIGRQAIRAGFLIDPSKSFLTGKAKKKRSAKKEKA